MSHYALIKLFLTQELVHQHKQDLLGRLWLLIQPVVYIFIFMTIFSQIMGMKLNIALDSQLPATYAYSIYLICGLLAWQLFANTLQQMTSVYQAKSSIIRKLPISIRWFPLYIPLVESMSYIIAMFLFTLYLIVLGQYPTWQHLWILPIIVLLMLLGYSLGLISATLTVFVPDIRRAISLLLQLMFWGTPIVYISSILPDWANLMVSLNPVYWGIENLQHIYLAQPVNVDKLAALAMVDVALLVSAIWLSKRLEADVRDLL